MKQELAVALGAIACSGCGTLRSPKDAARFGGIEWLRYCASCRERDKLQRDHAAALSDALNTAQQLIHAVAQLVTWLTK